MNDQERLESLIDAICESIIEMSDEEIWEDYKACGISPVKAAQEVRAAIEKAIDEAKRS